MSIAAITLSASYERRATTLTYRRKMGQGSTQIGLTQLHCISRDSFLLPQVGVDDLHVELRRLWCR
jgi:hypothetical protein